MKEAQPEGFSCLWSSISFSNLPYRVWVSKILTLIILKDKISMKNQSFRALVYLHSKMWNTETVKQWNSEVFVDNATHRAKNHNCGATFVFLCLYFHANRVSQPGWGVGSCHCQSWKVILNSLWELILQTLNTGSYNCCIVSSGTGYSLPLPHPHSCHHEVTHAISNLIYLHDLLM